METHLPYSSALITFKWYQRLPSSQQQLLMQSLLLLEEAERNSTVYWDYSYILMPAAKAYEGYVKDLCFHLHLISEKRYLGHHFRIGKALNPELANEDPEGFEVLYDDIERICGKDIAVSLWQTWQECRNETFHYFTNRSALFTLSQIKRKLTLLFGTIIKSSSLNNEYHNHTAVYNQ